MNKTLQYRPYYLYKQHLTHFTLLGKRPATIDAYSRGLRRIIHQLDKSLDAYISKATDVTPTNSPTLLPLLPTCHAINGNISPQIIDVQ